MKMKQVNKPISDLINSLNEGRKNQNKIYRRFYLSVVIQSKRSEILRAPF